MVYLLLAGFVLPDAAAIGQVVAKGWAVVDMKKDWKTVIPFEKGGEKR
jgi:hypothetical protein